MGVLVTGRIFVLPAVVAAALLTPAAASAATIVVDPAAPAGCDNGTCKTLAAAQEAASPGDTLSLRTGVYEEGGLEITKPGLRIEAQPGDVSIASAGTENGTDVLTVSADGVTLRGLIIGVRDNGGSALRITGRDTVLDTVALQNRVNADQPALDIVATSGTTIVRSSRVVHEPNLENPTTTPAVHSAGGGSLLLEDTTVISGEETGPAVWLHGSGGLLRASLLAHNPGSDGLRITSDANSPGGKNVRIDTSVLSGGGAGAGLKVETLASPSGSNAGDVDVDLFHATIAGASRSIDVEAKANSIGLINPPPRGSVDVRAERSIVHGTVEVENSDGVPVLPLLLGHNTARITIVDSDTEAQAYAESGSFVEVANNQTSTDEQLFLQPDARLYALRPGAPVIDKGGPIREGESVKDFEGDPRQLGAATDLGADEFVDKAPTAILRVTPDNPKQGQAVTLDASNSIDPEAQHGGGFKEFHWDFGDGVLEVTTVPTVTHAYSDVGSFEAKVTVVDVAGNTNMSPPTEIRVRDAIKPVVKITDPKRNKTLSRYTTKKVRIKGSKRTRTRRTVNRLRFAGTAEDAQGIRRVDVNFQVGGRAGGVCKFLDLKRNRIISRRCSTPPYFRVAIRNGKWAYRTKTKTKLSKGSYKLTVAATDNSGVIGIATTRFKVR